MGNTASKHACNNQNYIRQCSISDLLAGNCGGTTEPVSNESRSRSRTTQKSWSENKAGDQLNGSKTIWPISRSQSMFLPEFPIRQVSLTSGFTFVNVIARGAYGTVYKIQKQDTGECFALKVINKAKVVAENGVMQAKHEVAIQNMVGHYQFILNCSYRWQGRKTLCILTAYMSGGELFSLVKEYNSLPENIVRIYVAEIALAIDFLHNAGIVHRDIKATNILLDHEGHIVIIDFGLAKWLSRAGRTATLCGTPEYMAPEIFRRQPYGQEVDWWSLGVLTCFMLTNLYPMGLPCDRPPGRRKLENTPSRILPPCVQISRPAEDLLRRLLQPNPVLRLKSVLALQRIAFYKGFDVKEYLLKKESPFRLLGRVIPADQESMDKFPNFDSFMKDDSS